MISKYVRNKWVIGGITLLTLLAIALVTVPWNHAPNAKAASSSSTGDQYHNCNLNPQAPQTEWGYTFFPCATVGLGSECVNIHYDPTLDSTVATCAYADWAAIGYFDVICQTTGDDVHGTTIWDELVPQNGEPTAYVSDYYIDTSTLGDWSAPIPKCPPKRSQPAGLPPSQ